MKALTRKILGWCEWLALGDEDDQRYGGPPGWFQVLAMGAVVVMFAVTAPVWLPVCLLVRCGYKRI